MCASFKRDPRRGRWDRNGTTRRWGVRGGVAVTFAVALWATTASAGTRVAVQPFSGEQTEAIRKSVARILAKHGHVPVLSVPAVQGTSQYPGIAKAKRLSAFVVADITMRGNSILASFLVWQGRDGNVVGRWEVSATKPNLLKRLTREFWKKLGPAIDSAKGHPSDRLPPARPMRINAGTPISDSSP